MPATRHATHYCLADEADRLQGRDLEIRVRLVVDKAQENLDEVRPLALRELDGGDRGHDLGSERAGLLLWRGEGEERVLLDLGALIDAEGHPFRGEFLLTRGFLLWWGCERGDACRRVRARTLALSAFFSARPAALRT